MTTNYGERPGMEAQAAKLSSPYAAEYNEAEQRMASKRDTRSLAQPQRRKARAGRYTIGGLEQRIQSAMDSAQAVVDMQPQNTPKRAQAALVWALLSDARAECRTLAALDSQAVRS